MLINELELLPINYFVHIRVSEAILFSFFMKKMII